MICAHCGGSNPDGAGYCQFCGSALAAGAAPLPSTLPPPPPPPPPSPWGPGSPAPPGRRRGGIGRTVLIVIVVFVVIILVVGIVAYLVTPAPATVEITGVNFESPDNTCGLDGAVDSSWYNTSAGQSFGLEYDIWGNNTSATTTTPCEIHSLTTTTPGFNITDANVPLQVPANATEILQFTVDPPNSAYSGPLTLVLT